MRHFPLTSDAFEHSLGVRAIVNDEKLIEVTEHYRDEIDQKREQLASAIHEYACVPSELHDIQAEAVEFLLTHCEHLLDGKNRLTNETMDTRLPPLLSIALHVQEDLVILRNDPENDFPIIAGVVCFPSGWSLPDKLGRGILGVHEPVPDFNSILGAPTQNLMARLKIKRPVWRMNWGIRPTRQLDQSPRHEEFLTQQQALVTSGNAGDRCFLRVERQTLSRLSKTGNILFTIHTHQTRLCDLANPQKHRLLRTLQTCPSETLSYKGLATIAEPVIAFLQAY